MRSAAVALFFLLAATPAAAALNIIYPGSSSPQSLLAAGNHVFFSADDAIHGRELWVTDGTPGGTHLVADLTPGPAGSTIRLTAALGNVALFAFDVNRDAKGTAIWRSDGTAAGTWQLLETPWSYSAWVCASGNRVFMFSGRAGNSTDLWVSDGSAAAQKILTPGSSGGLFSVDGMLYFAVSGEIWTSDGTLPGTHALQKNAECPDPSCAPAPTWFFRLGTYVCFLTAGGLWRTDGTAAGTVRLMDAASPSLVAVGTNIAYFTGGGFLWRTDGTTAGTQAVLPVGDEQWSGAVLDSGRVYFVRTLHAPSSPIPTSSELWMSDGTTAPVKIETNTLMGVMGASGSRVWLTAGELEVVEDGGAPRLIELDPRRTIPLSWSSPGPGVLLGGRLVFSAYTVAGRELWISDGTAAGTTLLANIAPDPPSGTIGGVVRDAVSGVGIPDAVLELCNGFGCGDDVNPAPDGRYSFDGVIPGSFQVKVTAPPYVPQSVDLAVTAGNVTTADFSMRRGSVLSGSVRRASTGELLGGGAVAILDAAGGVVDLAQSATGTFASQPLAVGTYSAEARGFPEAVDQRFHDGEAIAVTSTANVTGIDFWLHDCGTIAGTVRDASNSQAAPGVRVVFRLGSEEKGAAMTAADGRYVSPPLAPGSYTVAVSPNAGVEGAYPTVVAVAADGKVTGIDLVVQPRPDGARVSGVIRDSAGAPVANLSVTLLPFDTRGAFNRDAQTNADGVFVFFDILPGTYYLLARGELYGGVDCPAQPCSLTGATPLSLVAGRTNAVEMQLRSRSAVVSGQVVDGGSGNPAGVEVYLVTAAGKWVTSRLASIGGTFSLSGLSREPMYLFASAGTGFDGAFYPNVRTACRSGTCPAPAGAQAVGGTMTGVVLTRTPLGSIAGHVYDADSGKGLNVTVRFQKEDGTLAGTAQSDYTTGEYRWPDADGAYSVSVGPQTYPYALYGQVYPSTVVTPAGVATTGIDFRLQRVAPTGVLQGRVVDEATGSPLSHVSVDADPHPVDASAYTDTAGIYSIRAPAGSYVVNAKPDSPYFPEHSSPAAVTAGNTTAVPDIRLPRLRVTSVSPATGSPLGGTQIVVNGARFTSDATLDIGRLAARIVSVTPTQITALTPQTAAGPAHVTVRVAAGGRTVAVTLMHGFLFDPAAAPPAEPASADLRVSMSAAPLTFSSGDVVTYTIVVANQGPWQANHVVLNAPMPAGAAYVSMTADTPVSCTTDWVHCSVTTLASGASVQMWVKVKVTGTEPIVSSATVSADDPDPNPANNSATATIAPAAVPPQPVPADIPTLGVTALLTLAVVLAALAFLRMRGGT